MYHPEDPWGQRCVSEGANRKHWGGFFNLSAAIQAAVYSGCADPEMIKHVLGAKKDPAGDTWHSNSLYLEDKLRAWVEARNLQRTKVKSKDYVHSITALQTLKFPANLRKGEDQVAMAIAWMTLGFLLLGHSTTPSATAVTGAKYSTH